MSKAEIIKSLEELSQRPGFIYSLAIVLRRDFFYPAQKVTEIDWRERLSLNEVSLLMGLMVKHKVDVSAIPTNDVSDEQISLLRKLFEDLHKEYSIPFFEKVKKVIAAGPPSVAKEDGFQDSLRGGDTVSEPIFYAANGAYDFQYWELAPVKYRQDKDWIRRNKGLSVSLMVKISSALKELIQRKLQELPKPKCFEEYCRGFFSVYCFKLEDLDQFQKEDVEQFLKAFSLIPGEVNSEFNCIGDYNVFESHPIISLSSDLSFLPLTFPLAQSIFESPFYWMMADQEYKDTALKHRGEATETIAAEMLTRVFGAENVHKNVKVRRSKQELVTDIDVLAVAGNKSVITQAKAKRLTALSKRGDDKQLQADFTDAVQKAYDQAITSRSAIIQESAELFTSDDKRLDIPESIDDAYVICLTIDDYPAVTYQTHAYLRKTEDTPHPIAINVFDLEVLCFYLKNPFEFLYYLRQRTIFADHFHASSEMVFLAYHLSHKLFPNPRYDYEGLEGDIAQLIDGSYPALRGYSPITPATQELHHKWKNTEFDKLVDQIASSGERGFTDALFFLYDIAGEGADELLKTIALIKQTTISDRTTHDFSMTFDEGKSGVSFICSPDTSEEMEKRLMSLAVARKYKSKANLWLGLGSVSGSANIIDAVVFNKQLWFEDPEIERFASLALRTGTPLVIGGKIVGRNKPCYCGSGKKYKKCHGA